MGVVSHISSASHLAAHSSCVGYLQVFSLLSDCSRFEYSVSESDLKTRSLEISVKNETGMFSSSQTLLGMALVDLGSLNTSKAVTQW